MNDIQTAKKYLSKVNNAKQRGHEFNLSFSEFKKLMQRKYCGYSGLELTENEDTFRQRSIDRIDNTKGYTKGNVIAVANGINMFKATIENPEHEMTLEALVKMTNKLKDIM